MHSKGAFAASREATCHLNGVACNLHDSIRFRIVLYGNVRVFIQCFQVAWQVHIAIVDVLWVEIVDPIGNIDKLFKCKQALGFDGCIAFVLLIDILLADLGEQNGQVGYLPVHDVKCFHLQFHVLLIRLDLLYTNQIVRISLRLDHLHPVRHL